MRICRIIKKKLKLINQAGSLPGVIFFTKFPIKKIDTKIKLMTGAISHPTTITKPLSD
jgi:hypothetical protein